MTSVSRTTAKPPSSPDTGLNTLKSPGGDKITYSRWNSVWTRDSGGWKRHNFQNTYINPNADRCLLDQKP
jgi:hypothetical protein